MALGRSKCIVEKETRGNATESRFCGKCDHFTMMPVISASGKKFTPLFILLGTEERYGRRSDDKWELPSHFLPQPHLVYMRPVAGDVTKFFFHGKNCLLK